MEIFLPRDPIVCDYQCHGTIVMERSPPAQAPGSEDKPGVILDYDAAGNVVGLEILNASQRVDNPRAVDYAVTA